MEPKKNRQADLIRYRQLIFSISFLLSLSVVITAFEWKTRGDDISGLPGPRIDIIDPIGTPKVTEIKPPEAPKILPVFIPVKNDEDIEKEIKIDINPDVRVELPPVRVPVAPPEPEKADATVFDVVESPAQPVGGIAQFYKYLADHIKYPSQARRMGVEGKVFVQFVINTDGSLSDIHVIKGIGAGCDEEAVRVLASAKPWTPGKQRGVPVRQRMVLPITFHLGR